jgi:hypothetical protein
MSLFSFLFHKIGKQEGRTVLPWGAEGIIGRGEVVGKTCIYMYVNAKTIPFETIPGMRWE